MIPPGLADAHFRRAAAIVDSEGCPPERRSVYYDLVINGEKYPPKYIVSLATKFATGTEYPAAKFNAVEAKDYFISRNYKVVDRRKEAEHDIIDEDDKSSFPEGQERFGWHRRLERDSSIARKAKAKLLAETGALKCQVCGTDFFSKYGDRGKGFIEAHHTKPVATLQGREKTTIKDIALVCSNCHRMLHRGKPLLTVNQLKAFVQERADA